MNIRKTERTLRWILFSAGSLFLYVLSLESWGWFIWFIWGILTLQNWRQNRIPVLMFHSISDQGDWIRDQSLVTPLKSFDSQMKWIARLGYKGVFLDALYEMRKNKQAGCHCLAVTLDDGYLDNWVGAFHILKKYNIQATVFVSTGWMDQPHLLRPKLPACRPSQINWKGYLGPAEIAAMQTSGLVDIQSHAVSHDDIFISDEIVNFISPDNQPHGLYCYLYPDQKPQWLRQEIKSPLGYPIFKQGEALAEKAFIPDPGLIKQLVNAAEPPDFFASPDWKDQLINRVNDYKEIHGRLGDMESIHQAKQRWQTELIESRQQLEKLTGKPVQHLAWPRNGYHLESEKIALNAGYKSTTSILGLHNTPFNPHQVERVAIVSINNPTIDTLRILLEIWVFKGFYIFWPLLFLLQRLSKFYVSRYKK